MEKLYPKPKNKRCLNRSSQNIFCYSQLLTTPPLIKTLQLEEHYMNEIPPNYNPDFIYYSFLSQFKKFKEEIQNMTNNSTLTPQSPPSHQVLSQPYQFCCPNLQNCIPISKFYPERPKYCIYGKVAKPSLPKWQIYKRCTCHFGKLWKFSTSQISPKFY